VSENLKVETGLTEGVIAEYLRSHPDFFNRHPDVLASLTLPHPHGGRAISLQERQLEVMRERHRALERRLAEMVRLGQENDAIGARLQTWTRQLLLASDPAELPDIILDGLRTGFSVPELAMRLWNVREPYGALEVAQPVPVEIIQFAGSLGRPQCGANNGIAAAEWLPERGRSARSVALLPLRKGVDPDAFGLIVLGSPDADRFHAAMGTDFLERIAEIASAALSRLVD
jgi:uncharacterized protein YigA (DUF484 family)